MKQKLFALANDPTLLLYGFDFDRWEACFFRVAPEWPPEHCGQVERYIPAARVPIKLLLRNFNLFDTPPKRDVKFIWITEFSGSTLFSKSLHETGLFYLYNETKLFSQLAMLKRIIIRGDTKIKLDLWFQLLQLAVFFQSKSYRSEQTALVKEWPLSDLIAPDILSCGENIQGIFFHCSLLEYLCGCLKDPERKYLAMNRVTTLFHEIGDIKPISKIDCSKLNHAQAASLHWLIGMYTHAGRWNSNGQKFRALSNTIFFDDPAKTIVKAANFFGKKISKEDATIIINGPVYSSHSKRRGHKFSTRERINDLAQAQSEFCNEIEDGLMFASEILDKYPLQKSPAQPL